jgi:polysaccharide biosynthesis/export protein
MSYNKLSLTILLFFSFLVFAMSSCSFKGREAMLKTPYDADTIKTVRVINNIPLEDSYYNLIKPEDELAIRNVQDMDLIVKKLESTNSSTQQQVYTTFKVNADGEILLPKIGNIKVGGLTRSQAATVIQKAYEAKELNAPLIDVRIANAYVILLGETSKQGKYLIEREDYELIDLLADAGGLTPTANKKMVRIFRGDRTNPEIIMVNLKDYSFLKDPKLRLRAKDVVYIEPRRAATTSQNFQSYSTFIQMGLVLANTLLIIYSLTK